MGQSYGIIWKEGPVCKVNREQQRQRRGKMRRWEGERSNVATKRLTKDRDRNSEAEMVEFVRGSRSRAGLTKPRRCCHWLHTYSIYNAAFHRKLPPLSASPLLLLLPSLPLFLSLSVPEHRNSSMNNWTSLKRDWAFLLRLCLLVRRRGWHSWQKQNKNTQTHFLTAPSASLQMWE